jgi:hypothetical protein
LDVNISRLAVVALACIVICRDQKVIAGSERRAAENPPTFAEYDVAEERQNVDDGSKSVFLSFHQAHVALDCRDLIAGMGKHRSDLPIQCFSKIRKSDPWCHFDAYRDNV